MHETNCRSVPTNIVKRSSNTLGMQSPALTVPAARIVPSEAFFRLRLLSNAPPKQNKYQQSGMFKLACASVRGGLWRDSHCGFEVFLERLDRLQGSVDTLSDRIGTIEKEFTTTREQYIQDSRRSLTSTASTA
eukprot:5912916-Amphidinium_carterae.4